jgi:misacylated tRNA(Ala) deacylase
MTDLLYYDDAYLQSFPATVTAVAGEGGLRVALDRTAFYPGGGGQPFDTGWLVVNEIRYPVTQVKRDQGKLWHWLATDGGEPSITAGDAVTAEIDWARRYKLMRTHTAMHILCGVVWRDYGASVTGGNMEPGQSRMDFEFETLSRELIGEIEDKCNAEIAAARAIRTAILPRDEAFAIPDLIRTKINLLPEGIAEVRTVEIVGLDLQADGGTHVHNTAEVGVMQVTDYKSKGKINKRIYIALAESTDE